MRKKPAYAKEEVDIQRAVMNRIGIVPVENERGRVATNSSPETFDDCHASGLQRQCWRVRWIGLLNNLNIH